MCMHVYLVQCMDHGLLIIYVGSEGIKRFPEKEISDRECHAMDGRPDGSQGHEEPVHLIGVAKQPEEREWLLISTSCCDGAPPVIRVIMLR